MKKPDTHIATKAGIAVRGAIGIDDAIPVKFDSQIEVDCSKGNYFAITLAGNLRFDCVNMLPGSFIFILKQDSIGNRLISFSSKFRFPDLASNVLSINPHAIDLMSCTFDGQFIYATLIKNFK